MLKQMVQTSKMYAGFDSAKMKHITNNKFVLMKHH